MLAPLFCVAGASTPAPAPAPAPAARPAASAAEIGEASVAQLLQDPAQQDWRVRRLPGNTAVLVIEFPGLRPQGEAMSRIAALLEKKAGRAASGYSATRNCKR